MNFCIIFLLFYYFVIFLFNCLLSSVTFLCRQYRGGNRGHRWPPSRSHVLQLDPGYTRWVCPLSVYCVCNCSLSSLLPSLTSPLLSYPPYSSLIPLSLSLLSLSLSLSDAPRALSGMPWMSIQDAAEKGVSCNRQYINIFLILFFLPFFYPFFFFSFFSFFLFSFHPSITLSP